MVIPSQLFRENIKMKYILEQIEGEAEATLQHPNIKGRRGDTVAVSRYTVRNARTIANKILWLCKELRKAQAKVKK
jgi:hypothetical protein